MVLQEFTFKVFSGPSWHVYSEVSTSENQSTLVFHRYFPDKPEELIEVKDPRYPELFKKINDQKPGEYTLGLKLTQAEWCWLRGVLHCLMCSNANQVPIEAVLVGDSKAL